MIAALNPAADVKPFQRKADRKKSLDRDLENAVLDAATSAEQARLVAHGAGIDFATEATLTMDLSDQLMSAIDESSRRAEVVKGAFYARHNAECADERARLKGEDPKDRLDQALFDMEMAALVNVELLGRGMGFDESKATHHLSAEDAEMANWCALDVLRRVREVGSLWSAKLEWESANAK